jgi:hypothetical protein
MEINKPEGKPNGNQEYTIRRHRQYWAQDTEQIQEKN